MKAKFGLEKKRPKVVLLFCAIMHTPQADPTKIENILIKEFGPILNRSPSVNFSVLTQYYLPEMGEHLSKYIVSFQDLKPIENLHKVKLKTVEIEMSFAPEYKRNYNLDPGYLSLAKTNMFTTKDFVHRVYIADGIFGEVNLMFSKETQQYEPCFGTYPDFCSSDFRMFLTQNRLYYKKYLKTHFF